MHRLFVAVRPPEHIRDQLVDLVDEANGLRWQTDEQLHLTLRFIGEVERPLAEDIAATLGTIRFQPFELQLAGVGRFAHRRGGTLWAGVTPKEPVARLAAKIDRSCVLLGLPPERRAFHPHITLARWSGAEPRLEPFLNRYAAMTSEPWQPGGFALYESQLLRDGAHYQPRATYRADGHLDGIIGIGD
jgi:2'-5' RNA ligase